MFRLLRQTLLASLVGAGLGCNGLTPYYPEGRPADTGLPGDTDTDTDTDTDSDTDTDTDSDTDTDTDTDTDPLPLEIDDVDPAHGTDAGGTVVEIRGGPFDGSATVWFGDRQADVLDATNSLLRVETPRGTEGYAHVRVVTDTHEGQTDNAFLYWPDGTGRVGLFGSFQHFQYVGSYWDVGTPDPFAGASAFFIEPTNVEWWELWAPGFNQCRSNYEFAGSISVFEPDVTRLTLRRGSGTALNLFKGDGSSENPAYLYSTSGEVESYFVNSAVYDLESAGASEWPAFTVDGALATPSSFRILSPTVSGSEPPMVSRSNLRISWSGGTADYVILRLARYSNGVFREEVSCVVDDTGSYTVPSNVWSSWNLNDQLTILVGKVREGNGVVPFNNADSGLVGVQWVIGAGFTQ